MLKKSELILVFFRIPSKANSLEASDIELLRHLRIQHLTTPRHSPTLHRLGGDSVYRSLALRQFGGQKVDYSLPAHNLVPIPNESDRLNKEGGQVRTTLFVERAIVKRGDLLRCLVGRLPGCLFNWIV